MIHAERIQLAIATGGCPNHTKGMVFELMRVNHTWKGAFSSSHKQYRGQT